MSVKQEVNLMERLGDFVKFKRKQLGWSQEMLAEKMEHTGVDKQYIGKIENRKLKSISRAMIEDLLSTLGGEVTFL